MSANTTAANDPDAVRLPGVTWLVRLRGARGYDATVKILGSGWFLILALMGALKLFHHASAMDVTDFGPNGWPALLTSLCLFLFYLALCWLILRRPSPAARTASLLPSLTAFAGTYLPWTIVLFAPDAASPALDIASAALLLAGAVLMVVVISHLGRCFSVVPQARGLVRTGPYAVVRHPLYLAEAVALLGTLLQFYSPVTLALFLAQCALQVRRIFYEEELLRRTFPDYDDYARSTARLIPYVW